MTPKLAVLLVLGASAAASHAGEIHSNGFGGGDWSDPASWREKSVPAAGDEAVISRGDVIAWDRNDEEKVSCKKLYIDPKGALTFKTGIGRAVFSVAGPVESYGAIKMDGSRSAADRLELRLVGSSAEERTMKLLKGAALLVTGRRALAHGQHNVAITAPAIAKQTEASARIEATAGVTIDLQRTELVNVHLSASGIDNTGAKANERLNLSENHFTGVSHVSLTGCDTPLIAENAFELTGATSFKESAIYIMLSPLANLRGNVIRGRYAYGIQGRQQVDSTVTENTFEGCHTGVYWYGTNGMLKGLTARGCDVGVTVTSMSGVLEDVRIENCKTAYNHAIATTQLNHVEITDVPKDGVVVAYSSGPLTLLNCNIKPEQITLTARAPKKVKDGVAPVTCLYYLIAGIKGAPPPGALVQLRTANSELRGAGPDDSNVRNSPAKIFANGLTPLPQSLESLIVKAWTIDDDLALKPAPAYALSVMAPAAQLDPATHPLATMQVTPDDSWFRPQPNAAKPTVEVTLP